MVALIEMEKTEGEYGLSVWERIKGKTWTPGQALVFFLLMEAPHKIISNILNVFIVHNSAIIYNDVTFNCSSQM